MFVSQEGKGHVGHNRLDYDETWGNDAFLQDIFAVTLTEAPITLTWDMFGDPR